MLPGCALCQHTVPLTGSSHRIAADQGARKQVFRASTYLAVLRLEEGGSCSCSSGSAGTHSRRVARLWLLAAMTHDGATSRASASDSRLLPDVLGSGCMVFPILPVSTCSPDSAESTLPLQRGSKFKLCTSIPETTAVARLQSIDRLLLGCRYSSFDSLIRPMPGHHCGGRQRLCHAQKGSDLLVAASTSAVSVLVAAFASAVSVSGSWTAAAW